MTYRWPGGVWAAFPNNSTLRKHIVSGRRRHRWSCHPLRCAVPSNLGTANPPRKGFLQLQLTNASIGDFKFELFPLHSPLLRESLLVSFPWVALPDLRARVWLDFFALATRAWQGPGHVRRSTDTFSLRLCAAATSPEPQQVSLRKGRSRCVKGRDTSMLPARTQERAPAIDDNPTLRQTCSWENPRARFAFKDSMIY